MAFVTNREIIEVQIWMFVFGLLVMYRYQASVVGVQSMPGCAINERYRWQCQLRMLAYLQPVIQEFWYTESKTSKISHTPGSLLRQGQINTRKKQAIVSRSEVEILISISFCREKQNRTLTLWSKLLCCCQSITTIAHHCYGFSVLIRIHISIGQQLKVLFWHLMIFI